MQSPLFILPLNAFFIFWTWKPSWWVIGSFLSAGAADMQLILAWKLQEQMPGRSGAVVATAGIVRRGWQMFSYHSVRQDALQQNSEPSWFFRISEIKMKHKMQDDGICHNLHCPGKMWVDRAMYLGACRGPRAGYRGSVAEIIWWYVHQLQMLHKRFVKIK